IIDMDYAEIILIEHTNSKAKILTGRGQVYILQSVITKGGLKTIINQLSTKKIQIDEVEEINESDLLRVEEEPVPLNNKKVKPRERKESIQVDVFGDGHKQSSFGAEGKLRFKILNAVGLAPV